MVSQTRYVLDQYQSNGGTYTEAVLEDTPFVEKPEQFLNLFNTFLENHK